MKASPAMKTLPRQSAGPEMEAHVMDGIDPVTLVVVQNGLQQVASEMDLTFERAAFSPVISEGFDRSDGIYDKRQRRRHRPGRAGAAHLRRRHAVHDARGDRPREGGGEPLRPGDIFIVNDPYCGGTHLMDVKMVKPYFYRGQLWAYLSNTGHWPDTGGSVPGGFSHAGHRGAAGGPAAAAREALPRGRDAARHPQHHPRQHPGARGAHRRHQGPGGRAHRGREAPHRAARPLRRARR